MAKKVRRSPEEETVQFEFPAFDEAKFLTKEFELGTAMALATALTVGAGVLSWLATAFGLPLYVPFALGILFVIASPWVIGRLRSRSDLYTKGDWAALLALEFFGWIAIWFVLVNVT